MAPSMYHPSVTEGMEIEERWLEDEIVVRPRWVPDRPLEIVDAVHIHDRCIVARKRLPNYTHTATDVDKLLRYMRRQGIAPMDVDIVDSTKGFLDPEKAESLRVHAPERKWSPLPKEIQKIKDAAFCFKEFKPNFRFPVKKR